MSVNYKNNVDLEIVYAKNPKTNLYDHADDQLP